MLQHVLDDALGQKELGANVDVVKSVELLRSDVQERLVEGDAGIVHQAINAAQKRNRLVPQFHRLVHAIEIRLKSLGPAAQCLNFVGCRLCSGGVMSEMEHNIRSLSAKLERDFTSDPCPEPVTSTRLPAIFCVVCMPNFVV